MRADNYQKQIKIVETSGPATEPVTTAELKSHLRVDSSDEDTLIANLGKAARVTIEQLTGHRTITRSEKLWLDDFPPCEGIMIPVFPVSAIGTLSWFDEDDVETNVDAAIFKTDVVGPVSRIMLKSGQTWPVLTTTKRPVNAVSVPFTSGYANAAAVPEPLKLAIKLLAGHFYENREDTTPLTIAQIPFGIRQLLVPYTIWERKV